MIAKAGLGLIGLGAISVGGVALAKPAWLGMSDSMPEWHSLSEDSGFSGSSTDYTEGKFGKKYGKYLVGVSNSENKDWWEWAYIRLNNENIKPAKFAGVGKGYDSNASDEKALNTVCKKAYETEISGGFATGNEADKFNKSDVWKYCSPGSLTHTNTDNPLYPNGKIGGDDSNKIVLVSIKDNSNDWFWEIRNRDFWATSGDWSGNGATESSSFKTKYSADKDKEANLKTTIKKICEEAYELDTSSQENKNNTDAKKFCVLEASGS